jgi:hypothetical protein
MKIGSNEYNRPIQVAIIGYGTIGKLHSRILNKLGAKICAVSSSTIESTERASTEVFNLYGNKPYTSIDAGDIIRKCNPDCIFICTPPDRHFKDIIIALEYKIPIFCEKPLIWNNNYNREGIFRDLNYIKNMKSRKLFCNFANNNLLKSLIKKAEIKEEIKFLKFVFNTHGKHKNRSIAVDLMPHGIAMLICLAGALGKVKYYSETCEEIKFRCKFQFDNIETHFEFGQSINFDKKFQIELNNRRFDRKDKQEDGLYKVWFDEHNKTSKYTMSNPFEDEINNFLKFVRNKSPKKVDTFMNAFYNTKILADLLIRP